MNWLHRAMCFDFWRHRHPTTPLRRRPVTDRCATRFAWPSSVSVWPHRSPHDTTISASGDLLPKRHPKKMSYHLGSQTKRMRTYISRLHMRRQMHPWYICLYKYIYNYIYIRMHINRYKHMYLYIHINIYISISIYIYLYICMYAIQSIHIYTYRLINPRFPRLL